jgi:hypothetical protein
MNRYYEPTEEEMGLIQVSIPGAAAASGKLLMLLFSAPIIFTT